MAEIIQDKCGKCGEPISVELNCPHRVPRQDNKRPFYPDVGLPDGVDPKLYNVNAISVFRCRQCGSAVSDTVPAAAYATTFSA